MRADNCREHIPSISVSHPYLRPFLSREDRGGSLADGARCAPSACPPATPRGLAHFRVINHPFSTLSPISGVKLC